MVSVRDSEFENKSQSSNLVINSTFLNSNAALDIKFQGLGFNAIGGSCSIVVRWTAGQQVNKSSDQSYTWGMIRNKNSSH